MFLYNDGLLAIALNMVIHTCICFESMVTPLGRLTVPSLFIVGIIPLMFIMLKVLFVVLSAADDRRVDIVFLGVASDDVGGDDAGAILLLLLLLLL